MSLKMSPALQPSDRELEEAQPRYLLGWNQVQIRYVNTERKERSAEVRHNGVTALQRRVVTCYHLKTEDLGTGKLYNLTLELPASRDVVLSEGDVLKVGSYLGGTLGFRKKLRVRCETWVPFVVRDLNRRQDLLRFKLPKATEESHRLPTLLAGGTACLLLGLLRFALLNDHVASLPFGQLVQSRIQQVPFVLWAGACLAAGGSAALWMFLWRCGSSRKLEQHFLRTRLYPFLDKWGKDLQ